MTEPGLRIPRHAAIIMDGNGRWARARGLPRFHGHRQGVETVKTIVKAARDFGIEYLTLYSFSTENWSRPAEEVGELMKLLKIFIRRDLAELHENNVRIRVIGEKQGMPADVAGLLTDAENLTRNNTANTLVIAFNYGSRYEIAAAARRLAMRVASGEIDPADIDCDMVSGSLFTDGIPDPDLIIRTGGETRLSNFLLWQAAYAELVFMDCMWPEFGKDHLRAALVEFSKRSRRLGGVVVPVPVRGLGS